MTPDPAPGTSWPSLMVCRPHAGRLGSMASRRYRDAVAGKLGEEVDREDTSGRGSAVDQWTFLGGYLLTGEPPRLDRRPATGD